MNIHELVDWLEKHADPEGSVVVELSSEGWFGTVTEVVLGNAEDDSGVTLKALTS